MTAWLELWWPYLAAVLLGLAELAAAAHAIVNKREVRAATAWVGLILLVPGFGVLLYLLLGIDRIKRVAVRVRGGMKRYQHTSHARVTATALASRLAPPDAHLAEVARTIDGTSRWPLLPGHRVTMLRDGDEAYPEMLRCIDAATRSVALVSYIFDNDPAGQRFVDALAAARARGVEVRVLIDDAGARYSWPAVDRLLRQRGVPVARFMRVRAPWSAAFANLRNHRKIMVVDGTIGFTGGMNIRARVRARRPPVDADPRSALPRRRSGRHPADGRVRRGLDVRDRRGARRRALVPRAAAGRRRVRARDLRWARW